MTRNGGSFKRVIEVPGWQPSRKCGPEPCNHKELNSANNLSQLGKRFICRISRKECSPISTWFLPLWDSAQRTPLSHAITWISDLQNDEIISGRVFLRHLVLWSFAMATIDNKYSTLQLFDLIFFHFLIKTLVCRYNCSLINILGHLVLSLLLQCCSDLTGHSTRPTGRAC